MSDDLKVTLNDWIAEVVINRPPHNFFDHGLIRQIANAFDALDNDGNCRAIILAAEGKSFCAGANFGSGTGSDQGSPDFTEEGFQNTTGILYREGARLFAAQKPIIGAIQGPAIGGGLGLALVPDFRIVTPAARFAANFVKLGLHQGFGLSVTLPRLVGQQTAARLLMTGRRVSGAEAVQLGLADQLVDHDELLPSARALAAEIAENAPLAVHSVRATLREGLEQAVRTATDHELKEQQRLRATEDAQEGIRAVSERRPGVFTGK